MQSFFNDPRHFQIITLSILMGLQMFWADFGPDIFIVFITLFTVIFAQFLLTCYFKVTFDGRSPLITGLSLVILLKAATIWMYPLAAVIAIASKFLLRIERRHLFNPANLGIVVALIFFPDIVWVSSGQWGSTMWLAALLLCLSFLVLSKVPTRDMSLIFIVFWASSLCARAVWLGDPLFIPWHQLQSGALLIFAFFMISDPKTIPASFYGRVIFALAVCALAFILTFEFRIREGLFYALAAICALYPVVNYCLRNKIYYSNLQLKKENT